MKRLALAALLTAAVAAIGLPSVVVGTPEPTERPRPDRTQRPDRTPSPDETPTPSEAPGTGPAAVALPPARPTLTVGYRDPGILGQVPLIVAREAGYFIDAGFDEVRIVEVEDTLADIRSGELDIGVVDARQAAQVASSEDTALRALAGYQNYAPDGTYGGDLLLSAAGLVADEPSTVIAFLTAYIRALQDLAEPESAAGALALIQTTDLSVDPELAEGWLEALSVYAPFDGGFGSLDVEGGLGELDEWLAAAGGIEVPDPTYLIAGHTLTVAQLLLELQPNPANDLSGAPGLTSVSVGISGATELGPLAVAREAGYFSEAGFDDVRIVDIEEPLLGLLNGELDFGVMSAVDAADGVSQGLPLVALGGHQNYQPDGTYGGAVLVTSADLVAEEGSTVGAFLNAYIRALQDLSEAPDATGFAPFDGGFGDRANDGGLGELRAYLTAELGAEPDLGALIADLPIEFAQAWLGLPANPIRVPGPPTTEEAA